MAKSKLKKKDNLRKLLAESAHWVAMNMNDTFGYACAEYSNVDVEDIEKLAEVYGKFGQDGVNAFCAIIENCDVIEPLMTVKYYEAREYLKNYKFMGINYLAVHPEYKSLLREINEKLDKEGWPKKPEDRIGPADSNKSYSESDWKIIEKNMKHKSILDRIRFLWMGYDVYLK